MSNPFKPNKKRPRPKPKLILAKTVHQQWEEFARAIYGDVTVSIQQRVAMKEAFYGGFLCAFQTVKEVANATEDTDQFEEMGASQLSALEAELLDFMTAYKRKHGIQ
jgi:hypothetical protein